VETGHLTMEFRSDAATRASFPFEFSYRVTVDVGRAGYRSLVLDSVVENRGTEPMPLHTGLHPYFLVPERDKDRFTLDVSAATAYDNITGLSGPFDGKPNFDFGELDLHLSDVSSTSATLHVPGKLPRQLSFT